MQQTKRTPTNRHIMMMMMMKAGSYSNNKHKMNWSDGNLDLYTVAMHHNKNKECFSYYCKKKADTSQYKSNWLKKKKNDQKQNEQESC